MIAVGLAQRAADQRREEGAEIDADIKDRKRAVDAVVAGLIEIADLGGDVRLEETVADDQQHETEEEQVRRHQRELADRHDDGADDDAVALAEPAVRNQAADHRRQINERGIIAVDQRGERLGRERLAAVVDEFEDVFQRMITDDAFGGGLQK